MYNNAQRAVDLAPRQRDPFALWAYLQLDATLTALIDTVQVDAVAFTSFFAGRVTDFEAELTAAASF